MTDRTPRTPRETPYDLTKVGTRPLAGRPNLVDLSMLGTPTGPDAPVRDFLAGLPPVLATKDLRALAGHVVRAHRGGHGVAVAMGGHVVKTGCAPFLIDLARRGIVTSFHMAGSTAIHDFEIAAIGGTSEDVAKGLGEGIYGMSDETGRAFAAAAQRGAADQTGLGRALGVGLLASSAPNCGVSLLAESARLGIPCTVHVAVGTDTVHMHPTGDGRDLGEATLVDFRLACTVVSKLAHGVWINAGSAVILPEVFLKAVTVARNTGHPVEDLTTANFDMLPHYRPTTNVVKRPPARGYNLTGHHELMLPLFRMAVLAEMEP
ncbi:MAG: hypothetical protein K8T90_07285 [Planctomycetes bacterium]|nr:hypothetical protein [Planctomycetota bacterium]